MAIHVLEHFYEWEAADVVREWKRLLKPGGQLILELPCMDQVIAYFVKCVTECKPVFAQMSWFAIWGDPRYQDPIMIHKWGYSRQMLQALLEKVGFSSISFATARYHLPQRDMRVIAVK